MKKTNKKTFDKERPLSWSAISSFEFSPEQWYRKYVLKEKEKPSKEMLFGKMVGEKLAFDSSYLPQVPRLPIFEHRFLTIYQGPKYDIPMVGYADSFATDHLKLYEYKTSKTPWTQSKADKHGQIDCYLLMLYQLEKIRPEEVECWLFGMLTEETLKSMKDADSTISFVEPFQLASLRTKRTMADLLRFGARIERVYEEMIKYAEEHL